MTKKIVFDNRSASCLFDGDVFHELLSGGHLVRFGEGQYGYGKLFLAVFKYFERACYRLALKQEPEEFVYPVMIPMSYLEQCGFFEEYPRKATFISRLESNPAPGAGGDKDREGGRFPFLDRLMAPDHVGKAAVCLHCYPQFANRTVPRDRPATIATQGRCYRYEEDGSGSFESLWEFIMREIVYLGSEDFVRERLREARALTEEWMTRLGLRCWIETSGDLFFANKRAVREEALRHADGKLELRISLPFAGTSLAGEAPGKRPEATPPRARAEAETSAAIRRPGHPVPGRSLAAASFNFHGTHFGRAFNISNGDEGPATTGCAGFGIERLTYGFLSQYGLRTELWPGRVREEVLEKP
ncbi:MAG: hypothetical protein HY579_04130 [Nitrospinae bacterium]|nr:hypothetical protein [Nitrospinota bacterium]